MKNTETIILWGMKGSPYVTKVMVALAEKELDYELREIAPKKIAILRNQAVPEDFDKISPLGKIPALQIGDWGIADSSVITAFLDKQFSSGKKLYPEDSKEYARALWFEQYAGTTLTEIIYSKIIFQKLIRPNLLNQPTDEAILNHAISVELPPLLDYLEGELEGKDWLAGSQFSMADTSIVVQLLALQRAECSIDNWNNLKQYVEKVIQQPSFVSALK